MTRPPIVFALDFPGAAEARAFVPRIVDGVGMLKVGLELFVEAGPEAMAIGRDFGLPVFLDLKLHDIPETVERSVARATASGARYLTVHAQGGRAMLGRAVDRASKEGAMEIVAVTILTSLDDDDLAALGIAGPSSDAAVRLARLAREAGVSSFVCSPREVSTMRRELGPAVTLFTPGIRLAGGAASDQKRTATARDAIADGASWLVVGRPIRDAADPAAACREIAREIAEATG